MKYDCLIIDDEEALAQSTCEFFNLFEVTTHWVRDGVECFEFLKEHTADVILLDINLEKSSGFELCKKLRMVTNVPILFVSARSSDDDVLIALNIGGDDYIHKPYSLSVLLAKVKAVLKRYRGMQDDTYTCGGLTIDFHHKRVMLRGEEVRLKAMEYKLLHHLVSNRNRVVSKEELFTEVWGDTFTGDGTLNVHVRKLREKIEDDPNNPRFIRTVWGTGYVFEENEK